MFLHLKNRGIETIIWVINEVSEFDFALSAHGISGIMTDRPKFMIELAQQSLL